MQFRFTLTQSGILEGFSNVLPNFHFRNGGIKRNWSKIFINFFANSMEYKQFKAMNGSFLK